MGTEEQTAVTITGVPQAAFADHNVQYQFRTENSGGQVSMENLSSFGGMSGSNMTENTFRKVCRVLMFCSDVSTREGKCQSVL